MSLITRTSECESLEAQFSTKCCIQTTEIQNKPLECIPLMLCDIRRCRPSMTSPTIFEAFDGSLQFRTMILHARVVGKLPPNKKNRHHKFEIDDCTAVLPLSIWQRDDIFEIQRLQTELTARMVGNRRKDILDALQRMLDNTKNQLDPTRISVGNKLFVFGRPDFFRGQKSIYAFIWDLDESADRFMELSFKDELIEWYQNTYPRLSK